MGRRGRGMTLAGAVELAAPHTWPASVGPAALGILLGAAGSGGRIEPGIALCLLCAAVLLQCAVNTLNDYFDFVKGTDTLANSPDPTDAALVYRGVAPSAALALGIAFLALAALAGGYVVWASGWVPLVYGLAGGAVVVLYSGGRLPISYLPLGECFSGVVMGGLIPAACLAALAGHSGLEAIPLALPLVITVGLIMLTNNTCDVERDGPAGRRTLPVLLGRRRAAALLRLLAGGAAVLMGALALVCFPRGAFLLPLLGVSAALRLRSLARLSFTPGERGACMGAALGLHVGYTTLYCAMIAAHLIRGGMA